ncbi:2-oxo acid dehydrogenase subunit E2, partial [Sphingomonadaceae bacterium G21617-S1]|nr:2-oxo acid dehydrogenase subunit E2 [Sphingomonadaceae bacterium G21617-S1]
LCRQASTNIKPADSRYDRGTTGGQVTRTKGLSLNEMSGGVMSVSSLGHIGGTGFTPIINAPEVAILGMTKLRQQPRRAPDGTIEWRITLPLSLSYDHRVINGADAARFLIALRRMLDALTFDDG